MPFLGGRSEWRLQTCDVRLQKVLRTAIKNGPDFTVLCGWRSEADQRKAVESGRSRTPFPKSKHNKTPSLAVDVAPYPLDWEDIGRFRALVSYILGVGAGLGIELRSGADWDRDWKHDDHKLIDWPHIELVDP